MPLPRFTLRQLIVSILWISIGFGGIALSIRQEKAYPNSPMPTVERVLGWTFVCIGVIPLVTTRRLMPVLILALCGVIPGGIVGSVVRDFVTPINRSQTPYQIERQRRLSLIPWIGMAVGSALCPILNYSLRRKNGERPE